MALKSNSRLFETFNEILNEMLHNSKNIARTPLSLEGSCAFFCSQNNLLHIMDTWKTFEIVLPREI